MTSLPNLFKYMPEKYLDHFLNNGELLFRSLSYFQDYEDTTRGDEFEGVKLYKPASGLEVTITETSEKILLSDATFKSHVNSDDIFIFCASTLLSEELAVDFKSNVCVEIVNTTKFISGIRDALAIRPSIKNKRLIFGEVNYYSIKNPPVIDWALPEKITLSKLDYYQKQCEYRFSFAINNAWHMSNTKQTIESGNNHARPMRPKYPEKIFKIGSISKFCKVHRFDIP